MQLQKDFFTIAQRVNFETRNKTASIFGQKPLYRQARQLLYKVSTKYELWEKIFCTIHDDFFADVTFPFFSSGQIQIGKNHLEQHQ